MRMKRIIIIGAGGFLGSRLVDYFVKEKDYETYEDTECRGKITYFK